MRGTVRAGLIGVFELAMALLVRSRVMIIAGLILITAGPSAWADVIVNIPAFQDATLFGGGAADNSSSGPGMFVGSDGQGAVPSAA